MLICDSTYVRLQKNSNEYQWKSYLDQKRSPIQAFDMVTMTMK